VGGGGSGQDGPGRGEPQDPAAEAAEAAEVRRAAAPPPAPEPQRPAPPPPPADEDAAEFGAGVLDEESSADEPEIVTEAGAEIGTALAETAEVVIEEPAESPAEVEPKSRKPRTRKPKTKAEEVPAEPAAEQPEAAAEGKAKGRPRRTRKRAGGEAEPAEGPGGPSEAPEDKPKFMGGAERRTVAGDGEEPEIRPFFEGIPTDEFDPDAPNDRFAEAGVETESDTEAGH